MISWKNRTIRNSAEMLVSGPDISPASNAHGRSFSECGAASLVDQQIWCWGRDIHYAAGNLLVRYGFRRIEKPTQSNAASIYQLEVSKKTRITLRGFGIWCGDTRWGGLFLRRFPFAIQLTPSADLPRPAWTIVDLPPLSEPRLEDVTRAQWLMSELIHWIRDYEVWMLETVGVAHRKQVLRSWNANGATVTPAEEMARAWRMLGLELTDHPERVFTCLAARRQPHA